MRRRGNTNPGPPSAVFTRNTSAFTITSMPEHRARRIERIAWIAIAGNLFLAIVKILGGLLGGSMAVLGDGIDSTTDVVAAGITVFAARIIAKPPDREHPYGRSPLDGRQLERLSELTGVKVGERQSCGDVNFARPRLSPCLAHFADTGDPRYQEALSISRSGQQALARRPRADMPGFRLASQIEIDQQAKYEARLKAEAQMRSAIAGGRKEYERQP